MLDDLCGNFAEDVLRLLIFKQVKIERDLSKILLGQAWLKQRVIEHCLIEALDEQHNANERTHSVSPLESLECAI